MWCSMNKTKFGECESDGLWSVKWMRWNWVTKWMSWILVHEINRWTLVNEMNEMKVTRQICNICYWQICYPKFFFININGTVQLSSINAIHVKQQNNVGFFIFKFILKYMPGFQLRIKKRFAKNTCSDLLSSVSPAGPTMVGAKGLGNFWIFRASRLLENILYQRILEKLRFS